MAIYPLSGSAQINAPYFILLPSVPHQISLLIKRVWQNLSLNVWYLIGLNVFFNFGRCKWVVVGGTRYGVGCVLITALHYGIPSFGLVEKILVETQNEIVVFQCKVLQMVKHEEHLSAYQVCLSDEVKNIKYEDLVDFHPLGLHKGFECNSNKSFVVLRYRVDYI